MTKTIDTNILVRYLTRDDATRADAARALIAASAPRSLLFPDVAMAELGHVLLRPYRWPVGQVADALRAVATHPAIQVDLSAIWLDVADDLDAGRGLVDAYLMRTTRARGGAALVTFDREIRPIPGVAVEEP